MPQFIATFESKADQEKLMTALNATPKRDLTVVKVDSENPWMTVITPSSDKILNFAKSQNVKATVFSDVKGQTTHSNVAA